MASLEETLYDHIYEAINQYHTNFISNNYDSFINNRLRNLSIDFKNCEVLIDLAILFHDSGKAHFQYQKAITKGDSRKGIIHELYSAALAYRSLLLEDNEKEIVAASIMLHHEYLRLPTQYTIKSDFNGNIEELREIIENISIKYGISKYLDLSKIDRFSKEEGNKTILNLCRKLNDKRFYICTTLVLHPLIVFDNYSAHVHRKGKYPKALIDFDDSKIISSIRRDLFEALKAYEKTTNFHTRL